MKRKTTELEQRLINNGYRLTKKVYGGRKSEKTLYYYYEKDNAFIKLDYTREKVLSVGLSNYSCKEFTRMELEGAKLSIGSIEYDINHDIEKECEEMVKCDGVVPMTFEELDQASEESEGDLCH